MADIFDEVEEDLRRAQFEALWKKHWPTITALAAAVVIVVGGWRLYDYRESVKAGEAGGRFETALRLSRTDGAEAEKQFAAMSADGPGGYRILARFRQATELAARDKDAAVRAYDSLSADSAVGPVLQDLARLRAAFILVDTAPPADITARMEPLAVPGGAFRHSARELLMLAALKAGDKTAAERWLKAIQEDPESPQGVRGRAELMSTLFSGTS